MFENSGCSKLSNNKNISISNIQLKIWKKNKEEKGDTPICCLGSKRHLP